MDTTATNDANAKSQDELIRAAVGKRVWVVVGASEDTSKYGNIIYRDLKQAGYDVYGVNPNSPTADGDPTYPTLADLPVKPEVIDVVVPRWIGRRIAEDAAKLGNPIFWLQPGAESDELVSYAESLGLPVIHHACAMVARRTHEDLVPKPR